MCTMRARVRGAAPNAEDSWGQLPLEVGLREGSALIMILMIMMTIIYHNNNDDSNEII